MKKYQSGGWYRGGKISKSGKKALGVTGATAIGGMIGTAIDRGVKKNKAVKSIMKKDDVSRKKARQKYNETNDAEVLGYFNDIKEKRLGGQYMQLGGAALRGNPKCGFKKGSKSCGPRRGKSGNGLNIGGNGKVKAKLKRAGTKIKRAVRRAF